MGMVPCVENISYHSMPDGRQIAYRHCPTAKADGRATIVFLPGYMSDMEGGKATAIFEQERQDGCGCLLLDYSGCGASSGDFAAGSLSRWRDEVVSLIEAVVEGPVIVIGSSMGGWLMLLVAQALGDRLAGIIGIAAAPDFSSWGYDEAQKASLARGETVLEDNSYGPEPTPTHAAFWNDAQSHLCLHEDIAIHVPVRLLHGQRDADVPWDISMQLARQLRSDDVQVTLVKDGDHRLSREQDIAMLLQTISTLVEQTKSEA